jgi:hypothetical protein
MPTDSPKPMSPTAAVDRHLEWLEYALAAARDEETRRQGRLDKATTKNRDKRAVRLAEVSAEVAELNALVVGLKTLQARGTPATRKPRARRATAARKAAPSQAAKAPAPTTAKATPKATQKAASAPKATAAPKAASTRKPATTTRRKTAARPAARKSPAASPSSTAPSGPTV